MSVFLLVSFAFFSAGPRASGVTQECQERLSAQVVSAFDGVADAPRERLFTLGVKVRGTEKPRFLASAGDLSVALGEETPYAVLVAGDPFAEGLEIVLSRYRYQVPFLFVGKPGAVGALQYARLLEAGYHQVVEGSADLVVSAKEAGQQFLRRWAAYRELARKFAAQGVVVVSPVMLEACALATEAGAGRANVLILGATGVGKERMARALHDSHPEGALRPFVVVNSATLQPSLAESLLFGHEKGAYTGANGRTDGHFREANGGTLVFDEVQNMPLEVQAKLLRVLQEGKARSVGGREDYSVQVRVIAISNRPLREMVEKGEFREDLFHRLGQVILEIPPLRERPEDLAVQASFFLALFQGEKPVVEAFEPVVLEALRKYRWPGNSRQLENVVQEALLRFGGQGRTLPFEALPPWFRRAFIEQETR